MQWTQLLNSARRRESIRLDDDPRSEFQRDYDRALFSSAVRRLQDKAQVFPLERNDSVRTRLTHSHEVANVARSLAERVLRDPRAKQFSSIPETAAIPSICATAGLLHDLGNPPFGHAGELAIRNWFQRRPEVLKPIQESNESNQQQLCNDFLNFEGNAQTMRLVCRLQVLLDHNGLNLTFGTLSALRKYIAPSHALDTTRRECKKVGFFYSEADRITEIEERTGCANCRNPLTYLVEAADDIVYSTVDIEDGVTKDVITWDQVRSILEDRCGASYDLGPLFKCIDDALSKAEVSLSSQQRQMVASQVFRTRAIGEMIDSVTSAFHDHYDQIMAGNFHSDLMDASAAKPLFEACKSIGQDFIYSVRPTLKLELLGRQVIGRLMDTLWEGVERYKGTPPSSGFAKNAWGLLSSSFRAIFQHSFNEAKGNPALQQYARLQLITDNVSGMTDTYAYDLDRELNGG